jgi:cytochrome c oxidase cbb3-type subunit 4
MDPAVVRALGTLTLFLAFVALCVWAWAPSQKRRFDEASRLPFLDEDDQLPRDASRKPR